MPNSSGGCETFADFQEAGPFRCLQPKRYGGRELDPGTLYQAIIEIGTVCGSSAWILGVVGVHNWHLGLFAPEAQDDVWGKDTSIQLSTSLAPTGTVEPVDGGFRLRGRWSFSSGCDFCHWAVLGGIAPRLREGAPPFASLDDLWAAHADGRHKFHGIVDRIHVFWESFDWKQNRFPSLGPEK